MHDFILAAMLVGVVICAAPVAFGLLVAKWCKAWDGEAATKGARTTK